MNANSIDAPLSATTDRAAMANNNHNHIYSDCATIRNGYPTEAERKSILPGSLVTDTAPVRTPVNRRTLLASIAALPLSACPSATPATAATMDPEWSRLLATYAAAEAEQIALYATFAQQDEAWDADAPERTPRPVKPEPPAFDNSMSLAAIVATTRTPEWKARWAAYEADAKEWDRKNTAARAEAVGNAEDAWQSADGAATDAFMAVRSYPVTTLAALAQKADAMTARYGGALEASEALALIADIRRLAGMEA